MTHDELTRLIAELDWLDDAFRVNSFALGVYAGESQDDAKERDRVSSAIGAFRAILEAGDA